MVEDRSGGVVVEEGSYKDILVLMLTQLCIRVVVLTSLLSIHPSIYLFLTGGYPFSLATSLFPPSPITFS